MPDAASRLLMSMMGSQGNTLAHEFIQDKVSRPIYNTYRVADHVGGWLGKVRVFIPPKDEDRVIMFSDNSGAYVHSDGLCTPMGSDISNEIGQWQEEQ